MLFTRILTISALVAYAQAADCTVSRNEDGSDDSNAILKAFSDCKEDSTVTFQQGNYSAYTPVSLENLKNVTVHLLGNLNLPNDITAVQNAINATKNQKSTYATPWFYISGSDVKIYGSDDFEWGRFHGFGEQWWDLGNRTLRPQLATFNVTDGLLSGLKVVKPIAWGWNLPGKNIRVENHYVDAYPLNSTRENTVSFPFNTDGINVSGKNITIDGYYGHNGDDCVSVINGADGVLAQNGYCGFSSHGLSIGSLGKNGSEQTVENVIFRNWTMDGAVYGARFKSWTGGRGYARNITWEDITLKNVSTGIFITQNYYDQDIGGKPENDDNASTEITNLRFNNFSGSLGTNWTDGTCKSSPCWNYVEGVDVGMAVILDLFPGTANNLTFNEINIVTAEDKNSSVVCDSDALDGEDLDALGFECQNGPYTIGSSSDTGSDDAVTTNSVTSNILYAVAMVGITMYWQ